MIKNPKKNYSLKGKPLSTKIAFVVICAFIFAMFLGSFGGLLYLGRSCSNISTVSAEEIDGTGSTTTTTISTYATLNLSSLHYSIYEPLDEDGELVTDYLEFMFFLPITVRSVTTGGVSTTYLDVQSWDLENEGVFNHSYVISDFVAGQQIDFNCGVMDIYYTSEVNVGFRIAAATNIVDEFSTLSYIEFSFYGNDLSRRALGLKLYDTAGRYREYTITPLYQLGSRGYFLNPNTGYSATFKYSLSPFNIDSVSNAYAQGYKDGKYLADSTLRAMYNSGYITGFSAGEIAGASDSGSYTFASLLDAVFYAPTKFFVSLFNFDFLGVNVLGFVTTLITVVIAFGIIKFFL